MAVLDIIPVVTYGRGGLTNALTALKYPIPFPVTNATDIEIRFDGGTIKNAGDFAYTVDKTGSGNWEVNFVKAPKTADPTVQSVQIRRDTPYTRDTNYTDNGDLLAATLNDDFDRLWLCLQEQRASADASLTKPTSSRGWDGQDLPIIQIADGTADNDAATVGQVRRFTQTAQQSATASAASATQSAASATASATAQKKAEDAQKAAETAYQNASTQRGLAQSAAQQAANDATAAAQAQIAPLVAQAEGFKNQAATLKGQAEAAATTAGIDAATQANALIAPSLASAKAAQTAAETAANKAATDAAAAVAPLIQPYVTEATRQAGIATAQANNAAASAGAAAASATLAGQKATAATDQAVLAKASADAAANSAAAADASKNATQAIQNSTAQAASAAATTAAAAASLQNSQDAATAKAGADDAKTDAQAAQAAAEAAQTAAETAQTAAEAALANLKAAALQKTANLSDVADKAAALLNLQAGKPLPVVDGVAPGDAVTVRQLSKATGSTGATMNGVLNSFIGAVEWFNGSRSKLPAGYIAADGQLLKRADQPELWEAVANGFLNSVSNVDWCGNDTTNPEGFGQYRGMYSLGLKADNATAGTIADGVTFRVPDLNGAKVKGVDGWTYGTSSPALHLRGDTWSTDGAKKAGTVVRNAAPNIVGNTGASIITGLSQAGAAQGSGAFVPKTVTLTNGSKWALPSTTGPAVTYVSRLDIDASKSAGSYGRDHTTEVRPNSAAGIWIIRASAFSVKADSAFSVIDAEAVKPTTGTVSGGEITSDYMAAGALLARASLMVNKTIGGAAVASVTVTDNETDPANPVINTLYLPARNGTLTTREQIGWGNKDAAEMRKPDGTATFDANDLRINGLYSGAGDNAVNFPTTITANYGPIMHMARYDNGTMAQLSFSPSGGMAVRGSGDGGKSWGSWYVPGYRNAANMWNQTQSHGVASGEHVRCVAAMGQPNYIIGRSVDNASTGGRWQVGNASADNNMVMANLATGGAIWLYQQGHVLIRGKSAANGANRDLTINTSGNVSFPLGGYIDATGWHASSDERLKQNIAPAAKGALYRIASIELKEFNYRIDGSYARGMIAQQVQKIDPLYVSTDDKGFMAVSQSALIADLIGAIQELKAEVEALKANK